MEGITARCAAGVDLSEKLGRRWAIIDVVRCESRCCARVCPS